MSALRSVLFLVSSVLPLTSFPEVVLNITIYLSQSVAQTCCFEREEKDLRVGIDDISSGKEKHGPMTQNPQVTSDLSLRAKKRMRKGLRLE